MNRSSSKLKQTLAQNFNSNKFWNLCYIIFFTLLCNTNFKECLYFKNKIYRILYFDYTLFGIDLTGSTIKVNDTIFEASKNKKEPFKLC